ncbi:MAG: hypothetical protein V4739_00880 [Pseudomonadota bacterium]
MTDPHLPPQDPVVPPPVSHEPFLPPAQEADSATGTPTSTTTPPYARPSMERVLGEVRSQVTGASKREPYPWLAVAALGFTIVWLLWPEGSTIGFVRLKLWTIFVLTCALMVFVPMLKNILNLEDFRAWQISVAGAAGLGFAWVAFLLPSISTNQAFFGTFATVAAGLAAWTAPGKPA